MASAWIKTRTTRDGSKRYRVAYRVGGRDTSVAYAGTFKTVRDAMARRNWVAGELAAQRDPDVQLLAAEPVLAPTFAEVAERWRASRVDVTEGTRELHRIALNRAMPTLGSTRIDELTVDHFINLVTALDAGGSKRETIRKTIKYSAAVLDENGSRPEPGTPRADQVAARGAGRAGAADRRARRGGLPATARRASLAAALARLVRRTRRVGRSDARWRLRPAAAPHPAAGFRDQDTLSALGRASRTCSPRQSRRRCRILVSATRRRACSPRAAPTRCVPRLARRASPMPSRPFSPHDLRHRRISLLHRHGRSWAEIARFVGQRKLSLTADVYTHVLVDAAEVD